MPAKKISLQNAKENKLFYVVANVVVYRENDGRCLILKRSDREKVHPGKYGVLGGKLEWQDLDIDRPTRLNDDVLDYEDAIEKLLIREAKEEAGIEIDKKLLYVNSVAFIRPDETPVILVKFTAKYKGGEVQLEQSAFTDYAWVNEDEVKNYNCIKGIAKEVAAAGKLFKMDNQNQYLHEVAITAIIVKDGKYLITRRSPNKERFPGMWTLPGGKMETNDYLQLPKDTEHYWYNVLERTLRREVKEEVGIDINNIEYVTSLATVHKDGSPSIVISCIADYVSGDIKLQKEESNQFAWVDLKEAKKHSLIDGIYDELVMAEKKRRGEREEWKRF